MDAKIISLFIFTAFVKSGDLQSLITPCKISNTTCIENSVNAALPQIFGGIPELGVRSSDPLYQEFVNASDPNVELLLINSTLLGYKNCSIANLKLSEDVTSVHCDGSCKYFKVFGKYYMKGSILTIPVHGSGDYFIEAGEFSLKIDIKLDKIKRSDGKSYFVIKDFKLIPTPLKPITFEFKDLYKDQKDMADSLHKFFLENWKEVTQFIQMPMWAAMFGQVSSNVNDFLENVAIEDVLLN